MAPSDPWARHAQRAAVRLAASIDINPVSAAHGLADRYRWGWRLIDFANGTFQGMCHGLAILLTQDQLPAVLSEEGTEARIRLLLDGVPRCTRANGSTEESFPYEASFCVTALVAYDVLSCLEIMGGRFEAADRTRWLGSIRPLVRFLERVDEGHAVISNHLATAVVALAKWQRATGEDTSERVGEILEVILRNQSEEGWFREYDGADPGYQSLCTSYLADAFRTDPSLPLGEPLRRSLEFLWYFAHPDGSFGGIYGSRNTRLYYPDGIRRMAALVPEARALDDFMTESALAGTTVMLDVIDPPNLVPVFNSYCRAATAEAADQPTRDQPLVPARTTGAWRRRFDDAGLYVVNEAGSYTIVSAHKGGVVHQVAGDGRTLVDAGVAIVSPRGKVYTSQGYDRAVAVDEREEGFTIEAHFTELSRHLPSPVQFLVLRLLALTLFRSVRLGVVLKRLLVRIAISRGARIRVRLHRRINLGAKLEIVDRIDGLPKRWRRLSFRMPFAAMPMASAGYWQPQDEQWFRD